MMWNSLTGYVLENPTEAERKLIICTEIIDYLCKSFVENKDNNKQTCIRISNMMNNLERISIFDKAIKESHYKSIFITEIQAYRTTKSFVHIKYSDDDNIYNKLAELQQIYN